ncbi:MAG: hypothetical protein ABR500_06920 [Dermatophilaceae bacterium]|nr:hypothetical protein [Intrasporangiaceae bacterium]
MDRERACSPPAAYLTNDGRQWLETWTDPRDHAEVSRSASDLSLTLAGALVCAWLAAVFGPPESRTVLTVLTVLAGLTTLTLGWVLLRFIRRGHQQTALTHRLTLGALATSSLLSWFALALVADTLPSAYLVTFLASLSSAALLTQILRNRRRPQSHSPAR